MASITRPLSLTADIAQTLKAAQAALEEADEQREALRQIKEDAAELQRQLDEGVGAEVSSLRDDFNDLDGKIGDAESSIESFERDLEDMQIDADEQGKLTERKLAHLRELLEHLTALVEQQPRQARSPRLYDQAAIITRLDEVEEQYRHGAWHVAQWARDLARAAKVDGLAQHLPLWTLVLLDLLVTAEGDWLTSDEAALLLGQTLIKHGQVALATNLCLVDSFTLLG